MIVKRFQNHVAESRIALPLTGVYAFLVCAAGGLFADKLWLQFGLLAISSFLIMLLNNSNALIRIYSRMVSCSFLALAVMSHFLFVDIRCGIVQSCFISFYLFLFSAYQDNRAIGRVLCFHDAWHSKRVLCTDSLSCARSMDIVVYKYNDKKPQSLFCFDFRNSGALLVCWCLLHILRTNGLHSKPFPGAHSV